MWMVVSENNIKKCEGIVAGRESLLLLAMRCMIALRNNFWVNSHG